jgi:S-formylglutathione hydrolase FrmB
MAIAKMKIRKTFLALFILALLAAAAVGQKRTDAGKFVDAKIPAPSLKGNLLGDPTEQAASIYLPPGYESAPTKRYPVIYLLHGYAGSNQTWTTDGEFSLNIAPILDALIRSGKLRKVILVAPNANNAYNGSFYVNSPVTGNWEDYIFRDVVSYIDRNYRTLPRASSRALVGHSMGGFGAVAIGMKHTDVFGIIYSMSPAPLGHEEAIKTASPIWKILAGYIERAQLKATFDTPENLYSNILVALSAALSPNPARKPFLADYPWEESDGKMQLNEAVAERWKSKTPLYLVDQYKQNLLALRAFVIDYGRNDEFESVRYNAPLFQRRSPNAAFRTFLKSTTASTKTS